MKKLGVSGSRYMYTQDCMEMESTKQSKCIKCGEGGEVLVCSDQVCRLAVHEKCTNCSVAFDDMGNFNCPYCWYRRAIAESNKARKRAVSLKKALSTFLDAKILGGDQQKSETESSHGKRPSSTGVRSCNENVHRLDYDESHSQFLQAEKDRQDGFALDFEQHKIVAACQWHMKSSVNDADGNLYGRGERTASTDGLFQGFAASQKFDGVKQLVAVKVGETIQTEHLGEVDYFQDEGVAEDRLEAEPLNDFCLEETTEPLNDFGLEDATTLDRDFSVLTKGKQVDAMITEGNLGRREEEEQMQPQGQETSTTFRDPSPLEHEKANIGFGMMNSFIHARALSASQKHVAKRAKNKMKTPNAGDWNKRNQNFPNERRKKLLWRVDEEDMLKEGVQKFSSIGCKNLPWRKILEFGRHVFDSTRTPVDLKDKWRKMLAKEF